MSSTRHARQGCRRGEPCLVRASFDSFKTVSVKSTEPYVILRRADATLAVGEMPDTECDSELDNGRINQRLYEWETLGAPETSTETSGLRHGRSWVWVWLNTWLPRPRIAVDANKLLAVERRMMRNHCSPRCAGSKSSRPSTGVRDPKSDGRPNPHQPECKHHRRQLRHSFMLISTSSSPFLASGFVRIPYQTHPATGAVAPRAPKRCSSSGAVARRAKTSWRSALHLPSHAELLLWMSCTTCGLLTAAKMVCTSSAPSDHRARWDRPRLPLAPR